MVTCSSFAACCRKPIFILIIKCWPSVEPEVRSLKQTEIFRQTHLHSLGCYPSNGFLIGLGDVSNFID